MAIRINLLILLCAQLALSLDTIQAVKHHRFARQVESGWSEWSVWSACSRSCGGGVSYQERHCLSADGSGCVGPYRAYRSCQIQDCPEDAEDFRVEQCAAYNDVPYEGRLFKWVPYQGGPNKCELNCMPKGEHFYYRHAEKVIDGTRCRSDSLDVCVDGVCRHIGCDMMLDSDTVEDMCGECGGDNSTCRLVKGKFTRRKLPEGYNDIHIIPAGASNARIAEIRGSHNYLALRNRFEEYYLNGAFSIDLPHTFEAAGTTITYGRKLGSPQHSPESITFKGPIDEHLFVVLLTQGRNHGIEYSYYMPNGVGPDEPVSYSWSYTKYSNCTKECGGGHQTRTVTCTRSGDYEPVPTYLCDPALKPRTNRTCNANSCPPQWYIGEWSPCSKSCDEGSQVRQVFCQEVVEGGRKEPIDETYCVGVLGTKPEYQQECTMSRCPRWVAAEWTECSLECGDGIQTRAVQCMADLPEPDESCSRENRPEQEQDCNLGPCDGVDWMTTQWTDCTGMCGLGIQSRQLVCTTRAGTMFEKELCDMDIMPDMTKSCQLQPHCGPRWVATHWSECSATCGGGVHSRLVFCGDINGGRSLEQVSDENCNASAKFETEEVCNREQCFEDYVWFVGPWSKCTVPCGGGTRTRALVCMQGELPQRQALCPSEERPIPTEQCNMLPCTPDILQDRGVTRVPCDESAFGCCEDGVTAAIGPFKEGCRKCDQTEFKCCPDGVTPAQGEDYAGCEEEPEPEELIANEGESIACEYGEDCALENIDDQCMLPVDRGICRAWVVKYFFDINYGQCTQFWYGGCGGNANLFDSLEDCRNECAGYDQKLTQEELCILPKVEGPCKGSHNSYYYDFKTGTCQTFKYGGCRGNQNRFRTEADCEIACGTFKSDPCTLPAEYGGCRDSYARWYFNTNTGMCEDFEYSGCLGNQNRFLDKQSCEEQCNVNLLQNPLLLSKHDRCRTPAEAGSCEERIPQWTYDVREGTCREIVYSGCDGNSNLFDSELSCQESCYVEGKTLCERLQGLFEASGIQDQPQCKYDGSFEPLQCPPRTGDCWCVTDLGAEIEGSRITRQIHTVRPDCSVYENSAGNTKPRIQTTTESLAEQTLCRQHQRSAQGSYRPQCTADGEYKPMQCYGTNMDYCWCVNENGEELDFTRTLPGEEKPQCEGILNSVCFTAYRDVMDGRLDSQYMPQCTAQGFFAKLQCHTERGCLCVDEASGDVLFAVDINPETATPRTCDGISTRVLTPCQKHQQEAETQVLSRGSSSENRYIPQCEEDGSYAQIQCYEGRAMYCWCVNEQGVEIENTRRRDGEPDCSAGTRVISEISPETSPDISPEIPSEISQNIVPEIIPATDLVTESIALVTEALDVVTVEYVDDSRVEAMTTIITSTEAAIMDKDAIVIGEEEEEEGEEVVEEDCNDSSTCQGASSASISQTPSTITARPGNMVVLTCEASGSPTPAIAWQHNGQDIAAMNNARLVVNDDGTLNILNAKVSDSGSYVCVADNGIGEPDTAIFQIRVSERPNRIRSRQSRIKVREGKSVTMHCRARATPSPTITWDFQGLELSDIEPRITKLPAGSLRLSDVGLSDVGTYKCTARNMYGIIQMRTFTLIVEAEVRIVDPPSRHKVTVGETITLRCGTTGSPKPNVRWNVDNSPIPRTQRFDIGANDELIISDIKVSDAGRYSCTAANGISSKTAFAEVAVVGNEVDPNCQDQPQYVSCELIVFANLCQKPRYFQFCCQTCSDNQMFPVTTPAP